MEKIAQLAHEHAMPVQIHLHETAGEVDASLRQYGMRASSA
jgi:5-methylthioadenosine/S-adenosylhomocysteine deaminase